MISQSKIVENLVIEKVARSAKLRNIRGTEEERLLQENVIFKKILASIEDKFVKNEKITAQEICEVVSANLPLVNFELEQGSKNDGFGLIDFVLDGKSVIGHKIKLKFSNGKDTIDKNDNNGRVSLIHELRHLVKRGIQPKYIAAESPVSRLSSEKYGYQENCYWKYIYNDETENLDFFEKLTKQNALKNNSNTRAKFLQSKIENLFKKRNFSSEEKVEVLDMWRKHLKDELDAYTESNMYDGKLRQPESQFLNKLNRGDDIFVQKTEKSESEDIPTFDSQKYKTKEEKINAMYEFFDKINHWRNQNIVDKKLFFPKKIKLVEQMLREEIQNARTELAKTRQQ